MYLLLEIFLRKSFIHEKRISDFLRDMKRLLRNPADQFLFLNHLSIYSPSLYAWFNIAANIDPYANTSGIKVAVANLDTDATHDDLTINAGSQIIDQLKENDQLGMDIYFQKDAAIEESNPVNIMQQSLFPAKILLESLLSVLSGRLKLRNLNTISMKNSMPICKDHQFRCKHDSDTG